MWDGAPGFLMMVEIGMKLPPERHRMISMRYLAGLIYLPLM